MKEIELGQTLEINNVMSFRGKVKRYEIDNIGKEMESKINERGAKAVAALAGGAVALSGVAGLGFYLGYKGKK